jgi:hypothetical protein
MSIASRLSSVATSSTIARVAAPARCRVPAIIGTLCPCEPAEMLWHRVSGGVPAQAELAQQRLTVDHEDEGPQIVVSVMLVVVTAFDGEAELRSIRIRPDDKPRGIAGLSWARQWIGSATELQSRRAG